MTQGPFRLGPNVFSVSKFFSNLLAFRWDASYHMLAMSVANGLVGSSSFCRLCTTSYEISHSSLDKDNDFINIPDNLCRNCLTILVSAGSFGRLLDFD